MKELTIEQKAKAYDEAIEKLRDFYRDYDTVSCLIDVKEELANLFPELKESEDERIRKALLELVHDTTGDELWVDYNVHKEDALAWLEKQGNPTDDDMKEVLRTEYEKGRADTIAQMQKEWSEEDEIMIANIRDDLFCYQTKVRDEDHQLAEDIGKEINWLRTLKPQNKWKPSNAQIRALEYIIDNAHNTSYSCKIAKELLEQLRKLKGE